MHSFTPKKITRTTPFRLAHNEFTTEDGIQRMILTLRRVKRKRRPRIEDLQIVSQKEIEGASSI